MCHLHAQLQPPKERGQRHVAAKGSHSSPVLGGSAILLKDQRPEWLWGVMLPSVESPGGCGLQP